MTSTDKHRPWRAFALSGPGLALTALLPKCPVCVAAWLSTLGLGGALATELAPWLRGALLLVALLLTAAGTQALLTPRRPPECCSERR